MLVRKAAMASNSPAYITGTPGVGNTLTANLAPGAGTATTWQWRRDSGSGPVNIAGQTASTYTQVSADLGTTVSVLINGQYAASISVQAAVANGRLYDTRRIAGNAVFS